VVKAQYDGPHIEAAPIDKPVIGGTCQVVYRKVWKLKNLRGC